MGEKIITNQYGTNIAIKAHVLSDEEMEKIGFKFINRYDIEGTNGLWSYSKIIAKENEHDDGISFNCDIYVNNNVEHDNLLRLDILDEIFCQPYDWQNILSHNPNFEYAIKIKNLVYEQMHYLQNNGVISGWEEGMYI